jgi:UDP-N-acetylmuramoyl-tripeptide--D-alanyl-D-alanine ligase
MAKVATEAFAQGAQHFADQANVIAALQPLLTQDVTVLLKGSRLSHMERIVDALVQGGTE